MKKKYSIEAIAYCKKGRVLGRGKNSYNKTHPLMKHFAILAGESEFKDCIHAELAAVLASKSRKVYKVLVTRKTASGEPGVAKPCKTCQIMLKAFGVEVVEYSTSFGFDSYRNKNEQLY